LSCSSRPHPARGEIRPGYGDDATRLAQDKLRCGHLAKDVPGTAISLFALCNGQRITDDGGTEGCRAGEYARGAGALDQATPPLIPTEPVSDGLAGGQRPVRGSVDQRGALTG